MNRTIIYTLIPDNLEFMMNYGTKTVSLRRCALVGLLGTGALSPIALGGMSPLSTSQSARARYFPVGGSLVTDTAASSVLTDFHGEAGLTGSGAPDDTASADASFDLLFYGAHGGVQDQIRLNGNATNTLTGVSAEDGYQPRYSASSSLRFEFSTDETVEIRLSFSVWVEGLEGAYGLSSYDFSDITGNDDGVYLSDAELIATAGSDAVQGMITMVVGPGEYRLDAYSALRPDYDVDLASTAFSGLAGFAFDFLATTVPAPSTGVVMALCGLPVLSRRRAR